MTPHDFRPVFDRLNALMGRDQLRHTAPHGPPRALPSGRRDANTVRRRSAVLAALARIRSER